MSCEKVVTGRKTISRTRQAGQLEQALASYDQVIELFPEQAWAAYYQRALVQEELGQTQLALVDLERATELVGQRGLTSRSVIRGALGRLLAEQRTDEGLSKLGSVHQGLLTHGTASALDQSLDSQAPIMSSCSRC